MNNKIARNSYASNDLSNYQDYLPQHLTEFAASTINPDLIRLNFKSIGQEEAFNFLIRNPGRRNDGRLTDRHLRAFNQLETGGWICTGIDPLTMSLSEWGCLKPGHPRWDKAKRKHIKYEHPHGVPTELFCLRVTYQIGLKIAKNNGLGTEAKYLDRMVNINPADEDQGFWQWVQDNTSLTIIITEGAKKAASLLSAGHLAAALSGIYSGYRSKIHGVDCIPFLIPQLEIFAANGREIVFCFDQDTNPKTITNVNTAISKTGKLLERKGCKVSVSSWIHPCKGVDDLIHSLGEESYHQAFSNRQSLDKWRLAKAFSIAELPQITVSLGKPAFADLAPRPDTLEGVLFTIKAAKGVGKTELIARVLAPYSDVGRSILIITHRIQLAKELARRIGINHISEVRNDATGCLFGYSLCVDSLHPKSQAQFNPEAWENAIVVIDECEQVFWHMLNSPTCQKNRVAILQTFEKLIKTVADSNGTVILSDADLSKVSINYINNLAENRLKPWLLNNSYNSNQGNRKLSVYDSPANMLEATYDEIEIGKKIILHCSSQKTKSKWSTQNLETSLATRYPEKKILRIDAETVSDPSHPAFGCIDKINNILIDYDIVLASSTIETGISIDVDHFDSVWALANGVQTIDAVCQTIERVRSNVDRHICITTTGITKVGNGSNNPWGLTKSQEKTAKANLTTLSLSGFSEDSKHHHFHLDAWSSYAAMTNQGYQKYKQNILEKLQVEGYEIIHLTPNIDPLPAENLSIEIEMAKNKNYQAERQGKIDSSNPSDLELKKLQKKTTKTKQERYTEAKGVLTRRYLTEDITDELILKDDSGWYPKIQLYYYLTIGRKHLADRDRTKLQSLSPNGHQTFTPDINNATLSAKVRALMAVNIEQFFRDDQVFTKDSLNAWHEQLKTCSKDIKDYLGVEIGAKSTPITAAQRLLSLLGYRLEALDRIRIEGKLVRRYGGVDCDFDTRQAILNRWLDRDTKLNSVSVVA
jgi:Domain of unknown function (DUF3854)